MLWVTPYLRFHFTHLKRAEIAHHYGMALSETVCDLVNDGLEDFKHVLLGDIDILDSKFVGDLNGEFAFSDGSHKLIIFEVISSIRLSWCSFVCFKPIGLIRVDHMYI